MTIKDKIYGCPDSEKCLLRGFCIGAGVPFARNNGKRYCLEGGESPEFTVDADSDGLDREDPNSSKRNIAQ